MNEYLVTSRRYGDSKLTPGGRETVLCPSLWDKQKDASTCMWVCSDSLHYYYEMLFLLDLVRWTQPFSFMYNYLVLPASMPFLFSPHPPASIQQPLPEDWTPRIFLFTGVGDPSTFLPLPVRVWLSINFFFYSYLMSISSLSSCSH